MKKLYAKYKGTFLASVILLAAVAVMAVYILAINNRIYEASTGQLQELYSVAASNFYEQSNGSYKHLSTIYSVLGKIEKDEDISSFIHEAKQNWGYTHFYFLDRAGYYKTISGLNGRFDMDEHYHTGIDSGINMVKTCTIPKEGYVLLYISPVEPGTFQGFDYQAIAIGYDRSTFDDTLHIGVYTADAMSCVIGSNGRIVLGNKDYSLSNIFKLFDDERLHLTHGSIEGLKSAVRNCTTCTVKGTMDGARMYIVIMPVGYSDWSLMGLVPAKSVDSSMVGIQRMTILIVGSIIAFLILTMAYWIWRHGQRSVREKETELKYQKQLFNVLSSQTDEVFLMFTPGSLTAEYLSPNVERVLGLDYETAKNNLFAFYPELTDKEKKAFQERINALPLGKPDQTEKHWMNPTTAALQWLSVTFLRVGVDGSERIDGSPEKIVVVFNDVTQDVLNREHLQEALDIAENANRAKSTFLSNMSHDIRTPINAIVGLCTLLKHDAENPEKVKMHTQKITASSDHLLGLINDILDMSKIESGKTTLNIEEFTLREWVDGLNTLIRPMANAKDLHFDITTRGIAHENVMGDKLRINQILINILSNAVKYTPPGGYVTFSIEEQSQSSANIARFRFRIADTGIGMSEDYLKVIFEPFTREVNTKVNKIQGTGLGMAITKQLVDLMGGIIYVESEPDKGSVFTVVLSLQIAEREQNLAFWKERGIRRALVVDDDIDTCEGVASSMCSYDIKADYTTNGRDAISMAQKKHDEGEDYDLFIVDMKMRGLNGAETALLIRERISQTVPIYILTAYDIDEIKDELTEVGISGVLPKPFFMANFMNVIAARDSGAPAQEHEPETMSIEGMHFLVAEDNELNYEILTELLSMEGASCDVCVNGEMAVETFLASEPGKYSAILMDVQMPVMNGYQATQKIRESEHPLAEDIPIIAMTANAFEEDVRDALEAGMNEHVAKPINMAELCAAIHRCVNED